MGASQGCCFLMMQWPLFSWAKSLSKRRVDAEFSCVYNMVSKANMDNAELTCQNKQLEWTACQVSGAERSPTAWPHI